MSESSRDPDLSNKPAKTISRRGFLKFIGKTTALAAGIALASSVPNILIRAEELKPKETNNPSDHLVFVDLNSGDNIMGVVRKEMGAEVFDQNTPAPKTLEELRTDLLDNTKAQKLLVPQIAMLLGSTGLHQKLVESKADEALNYLGEKPLTNVHTRPLINALTNYKFEKDELGNPQVSAETKAQPVIDMLKNTPQDVVTILPLGRFSAGVEIFKKSPIDISSQVFRTNDPDTNEVLYFAVPTEEQGWDPSERSFDPGYDSEGIYYTDKNGIRLKQLTKNQVDEIERQAQEKTTVETISIEPKDLNSSIKIKEPFHPDYAEDSLREIIKVCIAYPEKLILVAGGTFGGSDITEARKKITSEKIWPENLCIIGGTKKVADTVYVTGVIGADTYIQSKNNSHPNNPTFTSDTNLLSSSGALGATGGIASDLATLYPLQKIGDLLTKDGADLKMDAIISNLDGQKIQERITIISPEKMKKLVESAKPF